MSADFKGALSRAMKQLKATGHAAPAHHSGSSVVVDVADDSSDEYQPDDCENERDHDVNVKETQKAVHNSTPRAMVFEDKETKQRRLDEQVEFIILTRDNNKPDAYGAASETYGPLPWPGVVKAYNKKYGLDVGAPAMEKRARQHRGIWLANHPTYPTRIVYAKKPKISQVRRSGVLAVKPQDRCVQNGAQKEQVHRTGGAFGADELQKHPQSVEAHNSNDRIGGWVPPDSIRNQADLNVYLDQLRSAQIGKFVMELFDEQNVSLGAVVSDHADLVRSSAVFQRLMDGNNEIQVQLHCSSVAIVQSYADFIASKGLTELPTHLLHDCSSLMKLYCFAAQLEDDYIRELVLALWRRYPESDAEVNLDLDDLNLLFESTRGEDPARNFWAATVHTAGWSDRLIEMVECNVELIAEIQGLISTASR
jgi:hypothetical protein